MGRREVERRGEIKDQNEKAKMTVQNAQGHLSTGRMGACRFFSRGAEVLNRVWDDAGGAVPRKGLQEDQKAGA
jgi:hypothetical protein